MRISCTRQVAIRFLTLFFLFQTQAIEESSAVEDKRFIEAQALVEKMVARYPDLVRLTIHAVPAGEEGSRIIACNIKEKIGMPSDPEDLAVLKTNNIVVLKEGDNLDVTAPIRDKTGKPIAATGITLRSRKGETENQVIKKAKSIAKELTVAVQKSDKPLW